MSIKDRLILFIKTEKLSILRFEKSCGFSNGYVKGIANSIGSLKLEKILEKYPNLNRRWLLTGEGEMLNKSEQNALTDVIEVNWEERAKLWEKIAGERLTIIELLKDKIMALENALSETKAQQTRTA